MACAIPLSVHMAEETIIVYGTTRIRLMTGGKHEERRIVAYDKKCFE